MVIDETSKIVNCTLYIGKEPGQNQDKRQGTKNKVRNERDIPTPNLLIVSGQTFQEEEIQSIIVDRRPWSFNQQIDQSIHQYINKYYLCT